MLFARILVRLFFGAVTTVTAGGVQAEVPAKQPLRILVPVAAGGTSDIVARLVAAGLAEGGAHPIVVENKPGATGRIAVDALKRAAPDGTTLLLAPIIVPVIGPLVFKSANYDPAKDLAPVSHVASYQYAFAVAVDHPARDMSGFIAWAKANPARANFGTPGAGSVPHFLGALIERAGGTELSHIPYQGVAQLETELMAGQIAAGISAASDFIGLHRAGRLRILATSGAERSPLLPAVPTFREQGYRSVEALGWHGIFAPAGTPQNVIEQLSGAIVAALQAPDLRSKFTALGLEPTGTTPRMLAEIIAADTARWRPIIKATGFTAE